MWQALKGWGISIGIVISACVFSYLPHVAKTEGEKFIFITLFVLTAWVFTMSFTRHGEDYFILAISGSMIGVVWSGLFRLHHMLGHWHWIGMWKWILSAFIVLLSIGSIWFEMRRKPTINALPTNAGNKEKNRWLEVLAVLLGLESAVWIVAHRSLMDFFK